MLWYFFDSCPLTKFGFNALLYGFDDDDVVRGEDDEPHVSFLSSLSFLAIVFYHFLVAELDICKMSHIPWISSWKLY